MKLPVTYFGFLVLLGLGIGFNIIELEILAGLGLAGLAIYSFATFRSDFPINDPVNSNEYLSSNMNPHQDGNGHDSHSSHSHGSDSGGHGGSHDFGGGFDHGGGHDGGDSSGGDGH